MDKAIAFILGAAAGSLLTWKIIEKKYKDIADEEIESVREYYKNKDEHNKPEHFEMKPTDEDTLQHSKVQENVYIDMVEGLGYTQDESEEESDVHEIWIEPGVDHVAPYVISPNEYGEVHAYDTKCFTYYSDLILTDEDDQIVDDPETIIGDALNHFGDFEEDSVHVRNENNFCDYEIIKIDKTFDEINGGDM